MEFCYCWLFFYGHHPLDECFVSPFLYFDAILFFLYVVLILCRKFCWFTLPFCFLPPPFLLFSFRGGKLSPHHFFLPPPPLFSCHTFSVDSNLAGQIGSRISPFLCRNGVSLYQFLFFSNCDPFFFIPVLN